MTLRSLPIYLLLFAAPIWASGAPAGLQNFEQINEHLYRGAQPSGVGFASLAKLGVKTVVDLRASGDRSIHESALAQALGMRYVNVPLDGYRAPTQAQIAKLLGILCDPSAGTIFIHCRRGADRTGTIIAAYRIDHDHWDNQQALSEARAFKMAAWERSMQHFILQFRPEPTGRNADDSRNFAAR
jgi:protein tyrosine/serine phosphatase